MGKWRWTMVAAGVLGLVLPGPAVAAQAPGEPARPEAAGAPRYQPRVAGCGATNLLPNSSFEAGLYGWATLGLPTGWGGDVSGLLGRIDTAQARDGRQSLRIELAPGRTVVTYYDCWPACRQVQNAPLAANLGWIEVGKGQPLTLSAWMRADRAGVPAELLLRFGGNPAAGGAPVRVSKRVVLSETWERYSLNAEAPEPDVCVAVGPNLTGGTDTTATVWIDAVQLESSAVASDYRRRLPVEVGLVAGESGGFMPAGEPPVLHVSAANGQALPVTLRLTLDLEDYFGTALPAQGIGIELPAGERTDRDWSLSLPGTGFYRGRVTWQAGDLSQTSPICFVSLPYYAAGDSPFGINHAPISAELVLALRRAGVTWSRDWSVLWGHLEPAPGQLSYASADEQVQRLIDQGMHVVCLLPPLPSTDWNSTAPDAVPAKQWQRMAYLPRDPEALFRFMTAAAARYRGKADVLEFLNEPVWTEFCLPGASHHKPGADYTPADYVRLLRQAYPALKAGNPDCTVIGGFGAEPWRFTSEFVALGGLAYIDVLNVHDYGGLKPPETHLAGMRALQELLAKAGRPRPIWITEYAYYGVDEYPWIPWQPLPGAWSHNLLLRDERQCADWSVRYSLIMLAHGTERIFYHQGAAGVVNCSSANVECPLLGEHGRPRKLYAAQAILANLLGPKPVYAGELVCPATGEGSGTAGVYGYAFQCGPSAVLAAWCTEQEASTTAWFLQAPDDAVRLDAMGRPLQDPQVRLGVSPVYLTSTRRPAKDLARDCVPVSRPD